MMERNWWTLIAVCVGTFMLLLDVTIVNVALSAFQGRERGTAFGVWGAVTGLAVAVR